MIYQPIALRLLSKKARKGEKQTIAPGDRQHKNWVFQKQPQLEFCLAIAVIWLKLGKSVLVGHQAVEPR